jgi:hypothetical protein
MIVVIKEIVQAIRVDLMVKDTWRDTVKHLGVCFPNPHGL